MPQNWNTYKFSELYDISSGLSKSRDQFGHGFPFVTFKNVFYNFFLPDELGDLANTTEKERASGSVRRGDVFLTRTSETLHELGMSSVALKDYPNATFNGFCKRLRLKKVAPIQVDPVFIGYYLRSQNFRNEVTKHATMTTRASLNSTSINTLEVRLPTYEEQIRIGAILKPIDDKIELNLATNRTLEQMAMALYKHWFVDFGPFQGGNFIESELGLIPEAWETGTLGDLCDLQNGYAFKSNDWQESGVPVVKIGSVKPCIVDVSQCSYITESLASERSKWRLKRGDILVGLTGYVGETGRIIASDPMPMLNQRVARFILDGMIYSFVYCLVRDSSFKEYAITNAHGSAQANVSTSSLLQYSSVIPPSEVTVHFSSSVLPHLEMILTNQEEIESLTTLRDTLLPKLISGAVRVKDAERTVAQAI